MTKLFISILLMLSFSGVAQTSDKKGTIKVKKVISPVKDTTIYYIVEQMPEFPGGNNEMMGFLQKNVRYPQIDKENGFSGIVIVNFVVEKDGSITNVKILKSVSLGCDEEAMRVVKMMPKWQSGKNEGNVVRVYCDFPLNFKLK